MTVSKGKSFSEQASRKKHSFVHTKETTRGRVLWLLSLLQKVLCFFLGFDLPYLQRQCTVHQP